MLLAPAYVFHVEVFFYVHSHLNGIARNPRYRWFLVFIFFASPGPFLLSRFVPFRMYSTKRSLSLTFYVFAITDGKKIMHAPWRIFAILMNSMCSFKGEKEKLDHSGKTHTPIEIWENALM